MIKPSTVPHAILLALSVGPMEPERLRAHGRLFGKAHAVNVAIERLQQRGLVQVETKLTAKGRLALKKARDQ